MTEIGILQTAIYLICLLILVKPLGWYMARVYEGKSCGLNSVLSPLENLIYRLCNIQPQQEMDWKNYLGAMLFFNFFGLIFMYLIQRIQKYLPFNPEHFANVSPALSFNTAVSFITNTNWQAYSGETTMSYMTQMLALTVQNFLSAATGMSLLVAFIRSLVLKETNYLGNFWKDLVRTILYILLPLSILLSLLLVSQGVIQNFKPYEKVSLIQPFELNHQNKQENAAQIISTSKINLINEQTIPMGPVASQIAIKQLGTNGGGFFNVNSAHPFENPTPLTNFLEMLSILLIPAAFCYTFGTLIKDKRQGWAILTTMLLIFIPLLIADIISEQKGDPNLPTTMINQTPTAGLSPGGNMEGKETRFGIVNSALWASSTTAASNGSVNSMLDSFTPIGGFISLFLMHLGEVIFGGVGSGLYGMLLLIIITVFVAGLMVGRTPEYLGKKIEPYEMKMASLAVLIMPLFVLVFTAIAAVTKVGVSSIFNPGSHGFTELLYAFTSMVNNNGSAFAGLNANTPFYNILGGIAMLVGRFWIAIPTMAIAGSLIKKKKVPTTLGTLATHTPLFIILLIGIVIIIGALSFLPALALGPIAEHLNFWKGHGH